MDGARFDAVLLDSIGVTLVPSPRYLQDEAVDEVDAAGHVVLDEAGFWRRVAARFALDDVGVAMMQQRVAAKYCRNLNVWAQLRKLGEHARLVLVHGGAAALIPHWQAMYDLTGAFDRVVVAGEVGASPASAALYERIAHDLGCPPERLLVVDDEAEPFVAARDAGCSAYRYGSAYGLLQHFRGRG